MSARPRILVATSDRAENETLCDWLLSESLDPVPARALAIAIRQMEGNAFDAIIAGAEFAFSDLLKATRRARQSRAPMIVLTDDAATELAAERAGFLSTGRPIDRTLVMCSVTMALVESRPARRSVRKPVAFIEAVAQGVPAALMDVSNEGMRLQLPKDHRALPPVFNVRVPLVGLGLSVQRCWLSSGPPGVKPETSICGVALYDNAAVRELSWRRFVDIIPARA